MPNKIINNKVTFVGKVISEFTYSHDSAVEKYYMAYIEMQRLSGVCDTIPFLISEKMMSDVGDLKGQYVEIIGDLRSYSTKNEPKRQLILSVLTKEVRVLTEGAENPMVNHIELDGFLCKKPLYRKTPLGSDVTELFIAVNRVHGKSDYIPCICWRENACIAKDLLVGTNLLIDGRVQSREYRKKIKVDEFEIRTAYEVSISRFFYDI